ncbi:MAG: histidinol-phosphate aminotransferase family protein [Oscillospiraceae bacterium]|jgi:histidinol-phosphate aminotransferase|nr:histidinol-phosphate aminotransferase family protein [Oscillospiraceae bacterium]
MSFILNEKIRNLAPYDPISGDYPIRLDANESFLPVEPQEREAIVRAAQEIDLRRYPDHEARTLCQAAAAFYGTKPKLLTAWNGTDEAILLLCTAFLGKDATLLCYEVDFSMYRFYAYLSGASIVSLPKRDDFSIDIDAAVAALQQYRPQMFLFSNPCNPTSLILSRSEVRKIARAAEETGTLLVLDEAYMDFCAESLLDEVENYTNLVLLRTCSKAPGLAGLRLGFTCANESITTALRSVKSPYNVGALTQAVGTALLSQPQRIEAGIAEIRGNMDHLTQELRALGFRVIGSSANFAFIRGIAGAFDSLKARGIIVRRFGEHLRITTGNRDENRALLAALDDWRNETA